MVTADSDQVPTIKFIKERFPKIKIKLYFPPDRKSNELKGVVNTVVFLENHEEKFKNAKLPFEVKNDTNKYTRPGMKK